MDTNFVEEHNSGLIAFVPEVIPTEEQRAQREVQVFTDTLDQCTRTVLACTAKLSKCEHKPKTLEVSEETIVMYEELTRTWAVFADSVKALITAHDELAITYVIGIQGALANDEHDNSTRSQSDNSQG